MKTYKLTAKQNAKRRTRARYANWTHNAPKSYRLPFIKEWKAKCRSTMQKINQGREAEFPPFTKDANWWYW